MSDYIKRLKSDLLEQFKGRPKIEALMEVIGEQFNDVFRFYEQIRTETDVDSAVGKQLDGIGDIVALTRSEARNMLTVDGVTTDPNDEEYRRFLIYKILKNTCNCTYTDIVKAFNLFWDHPLYYSEDPNQPATMIFDTGEIQENVDTTPLLRTPLIRPAGVTLKLVARTSVKFDDIRFNLMGGLGYALTITNLPDLEQQNN